MHINKKRILHFINVLLDTYVVKIGFVFYPLYLLVSIAKGAFSLLLFLNNEYLKTRLAGCGEGVRFHGHIKITSPGNIIVGHNVHLHDADIRGEGGLEIGDNVHIARGLILYTANHDYEGENIPYDEQLLLKPVRIEKNVWIGINVCIVPGVTIGEGAVVGMGSTVNRNIPPLAIVGSQSIRILKYRNREHYESLVKTNSYGGMSGYSRK